MLKPATKPKTVVTERLKQDQEKPKSLLDRVYEEWRHENK